jgi:hypothetical protein
MKTVVLWNVTLCESSENRRFGVTYRLHHQGGSVFLCVFQLSVVANVVSSSLILVTLMMQTIRSSETSVLTRATLLDTPEDDILLSYRRENFKSYIALTG